MNMFTSITQKVTAIILVSLVIGIGIVVLYFAYGQNKTLYVSTERNLYQQADVLYQSIKNAMLPGEAPLVVSLFEDIRNLETMYDVRLYRSNGIVAFSDNTTLERVNANLGVRKFQPKQILREGTAIENDVRFESVIKTGRTVSFRHTAEAKRYLTIYAPLLNLPKCTGCHGSDHTIRGMITISADMTPTVLQARNNIVVAALIFMVVVALLFLILSLFLKRTIIAPVQCIGHVASEVTKGNFREKVSIRTRDELGELGQKINSMVEGLYERFELSKYVSSSTLASIKHSEKGAKTDIALFFSDIRGFTSFSERVAPEVVVENLNTILTIQTEIIHRHGGDIDKYVGDEIVALFTGPFKEQHACLSALEIQTYIAAHPEELTHLTVGIGINTGEVILGMVGSEKRADFTVIGDHVNFASRLCSEAKGGRILISESTYQKIRDIAQVEGPSEMRVKGKELPQHVYQLTGMKE
ncbi:adenylate/guanylate cyclase [Candidatus Vecturithrix granuli]|uniref:Adenylate/guanylate cyclase n=1 Tax=Vecturithrix granuli TaxID=1499967 RepID=A0A081BUL3_VECG1|nr:adenylate/guanylate cyclase [Candidatus Vecturithrix granuli]